MTVVFRSCLPRFDSDTNQSISNDDISENSIQCLSIISNENIQQNLSEEQQSDQSTRLKTTRKRGPRYTRIDESSQPLLTRLMGTIFGNYGSVTKRKKQRSKKSLLPSRSKIEKQFEENEQTLQSLVTLLTQIESDNHSSTEEEQARNNNRIDDTSSHDSCPHRSKRLSTKKRQDHHSLFSSSRKMIDNQQQTQLYPTKITIDTSTQFNDIISTDSSWLDVMRDDQTTINAWTRIRRRLKPHEQKDILRALMIICANLFDVSLENKHI